jgi:hypothetical protein
MSEVIHIILKHGWVVRVIELGETPDDPVKDLREEFDYKIENLDEHDEEE